MLNAIMLSVIMRNAIMLSFEMLNAIMLSALAPQNLTKVLKYFITSI